MKNLKTKKTTKVAEVEVLDLTKKEEKKVNPNNKGKTTFILKAVAEGKTRKEIIDSLMKMDLTITRKSNAGLVSHILKKNNLLDKVESGTTQSKPAKVITVKQTATKKAK